MHSFLLCAYARRGYSRGVFTYGVYDMAVVSRLAAESYLTQKAYASRWSWGRTPTLASTS